MTLGQKGIINRYNFYICDMYNEPMLRENSLKDKIIIVTGGGTGLGRIMTKYFLQLGAKVAITSRKEDVLKKTAEELSAETNGEVLAVKCDVRNYEEVEAMMKQVIEKFGSFNVLVNNAAGNFISPTERLSHRAFDTVVDIVLKGSYNCTLAAGKYWLHPVGFGSSSNGVKEKINPVGQASNGINGNVLSIVASYAFHGSAYVVPSACGKAGVVAMTQSLAVEWGKHGIRLNAIAPGPFPSKGAWSRLLPGDMFKNFDPAKTTALNRLGDY